MARGRQDAQVTMLAFVDLQERVPVDHPLRSIKRMADAALVKLSPIFEEMYAADGRPSIPPERLLNANLLINLFTIRSERAFCEELDFTMRYRWFLEMNLMEPSFAPTTFRKNRQRLIDHDVARRCFDEVMGQAKGLGLLPCQGHDRRDRDRSGGESAELRPEGRGDASDDAWGRSGESGGELPWRAAIA